MNPNQRPPYDYTEDAAVRRDLGLPYDLALESDSLADLGARERAAQPASPLGRRRRRLTGARRVLASFAVLVVTASIAGLATYATFSSSTNASHQVTTGTVTVGLGATGAQTNRLNVNATGVAPGDTIQRSVDVINTSSLGLAGVSLTTTASPSSVLDTDATNGLQLVVDKCSVAWTESGTAPAYTYSCGGTTSSVIATRAVIGSNITMNNMTTTAGGGTDHLRVTLSLPTTADNTFQNVSSTIQFSFTGTQRAGTDR